MAVELERVEVRIAVIDEIHLHAVDDLVHAARVDAVRLREGRERLRDRMLRVPREEIRDFGAPPCELRGGDLRVFGFVAINVSPRCAASAVKETIG